MNMIFNASAGTGKTWQVTELYSSLVLGKGHEHLPAGLRPVAPEKILLMTFTENAAAELRSRVSEKMIAAERTAQDNNDDESADRARRVLRALPAANISTIHAFCAGLLRANALELGISPSFQTLEEEDREALLEEVLRREIFRCLDEDEDFREFCAGVSVLGDHEYSLIRTIRALLEKAAGRGLDLSDAGALLPSPERTVFKPHFERIRDELSSHTLPATAVKALDALNEAIAAFPDLDRIYALPKFGQAKKVKHLSDELAELKERFLTEALYEQNIEKFRAFARCLSACGRGFSGAKRQRDAVDFGDQILFARDLLRSGNFRELFDWVIVDEVQDTSRVQCDVIEALWGRDTQLVICGDRKQSIYAWRSADPHVMPDLERQMALRGGLKQVALKQSFRSKDRVLEAVNGLFSGIFGSEYEDAALEPVEPLHALTAEQGEGPCFEFLAPDHPENTTDDEMAAVARRIRLLTDGSGEWRPAFGYNGKTFEEGEPFGFGDILILLKRSTHQEALEKALREEGISYTSGGKGRELFKRQEVRDLLLFLQVLCEPSNDAALLGFLRSPFANLPDDKIINFGWNGETFDHEILKKQFFESGLEAAERLLRFRGQIGAKLPSQLVREVVRETAFDAHLAGLPGGEQKLANFKKALDWLRAAERGGQVLLPDVVRRFEKYVREPPRSGAAEALLPDPEQNAVTIMTVHAAKGLTKRVCFVPDISFGEASEPGFAMWSQAGRLEMNSVSLTGEKVKSPGWDAARESDKAVREMERTNVFYVAMTRARDLVVFSGAGTKEPKGWLKQAEGFVGGADSSILRTLHFSEIPELRAERGQQKREDGGGPETKCEYEPLAIPERLLRKPVTALCGKSSFIGQSGSEISDPARYGSTGHAVLEELAKNGWSGDIAELVKRFRGEFGSVESAPLIRQLEAARTVLRTETSGAAALFAEHPFVLRRDTVILDGTMDLLAGMPSGIWKIFDYKFTNEPPEAAMEIYGPQLDAYREAVRKLNPGKDVSATLVLIGEAVNLVPVYK